MTNDTQRAQRPLIVGVGASAGRARRAPDVPPQRAGRARARLRGSCPISIRMPRACSRRSWRSRPPSTWPRQRTGRRSSPITCIPCRGIVPSPSRTGCCASTTSPVPSTGGRSSIASSIHWRATRAIAPSPSSSPAPAAMAASGSKPWRTRAASPWCRTPRPRSRSRCRRAPRTPPPRTMCCRRTSSPRSVALAHARHVESVPPLKRRGRPAAARWSGGAPADLRDPAPGDGTQLQALQDGASPAPPHRPSRPGCPPPASTPAYLEQLRVDHAEADRLFRELLISVTAFFRDAEAFEALDADVLRPLLADRAPGDPVRVWVPGCATGEEAYSIAMLLQERIDGLSHPPEVQIFATDIDEAAIAIVRRSPGQLPTRQSGKRRFRRCAPALLREESAATTRW